MWKNQFFHNYLQLFIVKCETNTKSNENMNEMKSVFSHLIHFGMFCAWKFITTAHKTRSKTEKLNRWCENVTRKLQWNCVNFPKTVSIKCNRFLQTAVCCKIISFHIKILFIVEWQNIYLNVCQTNKILWLFIIFNWFYQFLAFIVWCLKIDEKVLFHLFSVPVLGKYAFKAKLNLRKWWWVVCRIKLIKHKLTFIFGL